MSNHESKPAPAHRLQFTEQEAAELYGLSIHWFRRKRWEGGGPEYRKVGNRCYYNREELANFFNGCTRRNTSEYPTRKPLEAITAKQAESACIE